MKNRGNIIAVFLGVLLVALIALLVVVFVVFRMPKLSEDKMRENLAAAQEAQGAGKSQAAEGGSEEDGYSKKIEAFEVASAQNAKSSKKAANGDTQEQEATEQEADGTYLCSYSSERLMTAADVADLNSKSYDGLPQGKSIVQMVINEVYAKHGYQFQSDEIQAYFDAKEWYQKITTRNPNMDQVLSSMSSTEKANVEFLAAYL